MSLEYLSAHGATIPAIGLGTWALRGSECARVVADAIAAGYRHIDTAASYGNESAVGEGIRAAGIDRSELFITTKVAESSLAGAACQRELIVVAHAADDRGDFPLQRRQHFRTTPRRRRNQPAQACRTEGGSTSSSHIASSHFPRWPSSRRRAL